MVNVVIRVGVGLPSAIPGVTRELLLEWARRADAGPFSSLVVLDRMVYDSVEPFEALAAAAAVTERIRLATMIAIAPLRSPALLAKQTQSLATIAGSAERLTLGLGIGARHDDYDASGVSHRARGGRLSEQLAYLRAGRGADVHSPCEGVDLLVGGGSGQAFARVARYADGYAHGGGPPRAFASAATKVHAAWSDLGREGKPALWGQGYFALGDDAGEAEAGAAYLRDYYAFTGGFAEKIAATNLTSAGAIKDFIRGYEAAGCHELILLPTVADISQLDRLAEVVG
jgi:alkanesulfonate monooxygenase SsuD/methylene tetrahydromethanopterin reductase-like flavin-dependent oxidoreductase (luciferase family)